MTIHVNTKQAAEILGVSENTIRKWDKEGKIQSKKTDGGHRRFSVELLNNFMVNNLEKAPKISKKENAIDVEIPFDDSKTLNVLLENLKTSNIFFNNESLEQSLWMTEEIWKKVKYKRMVCIQPMAAPCFLAYYMKNDFQIMDESIVAKTFKYNTIMPKLVLENFEDNKDLFSSIFAAEIDNIILDELQKTNSSNFFDLGSHEISSIHMEAYKEIASKFDYFIVPGKENAEKLKSLPCFKDKDIYPITPRLNENLQIISITGNYTNDLLPSKKSPHLFCPYFLFLLAPLTQGDNHSVLLRYGWYTVKEDEKNKENKKDIPFPKGVPLPAPVLPKDINFLK